MFAIVPKRGIRTLIAILGIVAGQFLFRTSMRLSIDFTGGIRILFASDQAQEEIQDDFGLIVEENPNRGIAPAEVSIEKRDEFATVLLPLDIESVPTEEVVREMEDQGLLNAEGGIQEIGTIGPSIGEYMKRSAITSLVTGLIFIAIYTLFAFSGIRRYISPALLAAVTLFTLLFDLSITLGVFGILMQLNETVRVDSIFIISLLIILGYSINDTIVIFDRIRENLKINFDVEEEDEKNKKNQAPKKELPSYETVFETSVKQVMKRSIGTSISTLVAVIAMAVFGNEIMQIFSITLMVGVIAGTYSSIFVAAPIAYKLNRKK